jgi:hypothetical protein
MLFFLNLISATTNGFLSPQHGASSGCELSDVLTAPHQKKKKKLTMLQTTQMSRNWTDPLARIEKWKSGMVEAWTRLILLRVGIGGGLL